MATTKNLCAQISLDLHQKISEGKEAAGLTTAQQMAHEHAVVVQAVLVKQTSFDEAPDDLGGEASFCFAGRRR